MNEVEQMDAQESKFAVHCEGCGKGLRTEVPEQQEQHFERCWPTVWAREQDKLQRMIESGLSPVADQKRASSKLRLMGDMEAHAERSPRASQMTHYRTLWFGYLHALTEKGWS
jgi:hypothetical protein